MHACLHLLPDAETYPCTWQRTPHGYRVQAMGTTVEAEATCYADADAAVRAELVRLGLAARRRLA